jgi:hypothetical protein
MSFPLFSNPDRYPKYSLSYLVISLIFLVLSNFCISLECSHGKIVSSGMTVIMRSQTKRLKDISADSSIVRSTDSTIISSNQSHVSVASTSESVPIIVNDAIYGNNSSSSSSSSTKLDHHSDISGTSLVETSISKIENLKPSFENIIFDPGISSHNFQISNLVTMEADCKDSTKMEERPSSITDMNMLFEALSSKFSSETDKITRNFQQVVDEHDDFRLEVRTELDELRRLINTNCVSQKSSSTSTSVPVVSTSSIPQVSNRSEPQPVSTLSATLASTNSSQDLQTQMMLLMTESFSKLSTAFSEGKHETKSEWPKFNGDAKRFRSWYLGIMTQISLPPWQEFYDSVTHDIVSTMSNSSILALEGSAYKNFVSRKHLRANGLLL